MILLQIVMVSPRTDLVENNFIMTPSSEAMSASSKNITSPKLKMLGPLCDRQLI